MLLATRIARQHATRARGLATLSTIASCPEPTCACRPTPNLDIDHGSKLAGTMPAYSEQVIVSTGKQDWTSRIEDDPEGHLVRSLRSYIGPKGKYSNPFHNVILTHSSFTAPTSELASVYLLPSFKYISPLPLEPESVETFVKAFVLPEQPLRQDLPQQHLRQADLQAKFEVRDVDEILILICSHGTRDSRCGVLGPLLQAEFEEKLAQAGIVTDGSSTQSARVGLISHVGGHKWAGNVIIYMPTGKLAKSGIWYGRVTPEHVEGIVRETILRGNVIQDLFRGGIDEHRNILRL